MGARRLWSARWRGPKRLAPKRFCSAAIRQAAGQGEVDLAVALAVGPEILTGSTRLKAGTATKIALNIISTGAMVALGKVRGNLMIDLHASSEKLRDRATRVAADLLGCDYQAAREKLAAANWNLRAVVGQP